jgi:hypothetical protein
MPVSLSHNSAEMLCGSGLHKEVNATDRSKAISIPANETLDKLQNDLDAACRV